jgi:hypothetical protein
MTADVRKQGVGGGCSPPRTRLRTDTLLTGNKTGNFTCFVRNRLPGQSETRRNLPFRQRIPWNQNRERTGGDQAIRSMYQAGQVGETIPDPGCHKQVVG